MANGIVRIIIFLGLLILFAGVESVRPYRRFPYSRARHWRSNLGLVVINNLAMMLILPVGAAGIALWAEGRNLGLFNWINLPEALEIGIGILFLDLVIWGQHVVFHKQSMLKRLHQVHHADLYFDVTTGIRFHPLEIMLSILVRLFFITALGLHVESVAIFEILLNSTAMFNHSNFALPAGIDKVVRKILVTPDMHRVHHSVIKSESNSNYGFCLPWWDFLFGTYCRETSNPNGLEIGLSQYPDEQTTFSIFKILIMPFQKG